MTPPLQSPSHRRLRAALGSQEAPRDLRGNCALTMLERGASVRAKRSAVVNAEMAVEEMPTLQQNYNTVFVVFY